MKNALKLVIIAVICILHSFAGQAAKDDCLNIHQSLQEFVESKVEVTNCPWDKSYILKSLSVGFARVCEKNQKLVSGILEKKLVSPLKVVCSVAGGEDYPFFSERNSTIYIWKDAPEVMRTQATIFHEFLHYLDIPYVEEVHNGTGDVQTDPVFACHVTGYPEVAERILGDVSKLPEAIKTCSENVSFGSGEFENAIIWNP